MSDSNNNVHSDEYIDVDDVGGNEYEPTTAGENVSAVEPITIQPPADVDFVEDVSHKDVQHTSVESATVSSVGTAPLIEKEEQEPKKIQHNDTAAPITITTSNSGSTISNSTGSANKNAALIGEIEALKEKVSKLKALLGRSAKAQREAKMEAELAQKKLHEALIQNDKLQQKINKLSNRPTYMEMLADFETNFDRALLSVGTTAAANAASAQQQQTGGQDTASLVLPVTTNSAGSGNTSTAVVDTMLVQELNDAKQRIEKLERMNQSLIDRTKHMESDVIGQYHRQMNELKNTVQRLELEKKMAVLEHEHACTELKMCTANMNEMQYEIDLLTKSSKKYQMKASVHEEIVKNTNHDKNKIQQMEQQMKALEEWAIASNEAKTLAQQHTRSLEQQLMNTKKQLLVANHSTLSTTTTMDSGTSSPSNVISSSFERIVLSKSGSCVVGAGDIVYKCFELEESIVKTILLSERVVLRWKFDLQSHDRDILFSIIRGTCTDTAMANSKLQQKTSSGSDEICLIHNRTVIGGAEGETDHAFSYQRCCTLIWSNKQSWIRPKTIKYTVDAVVI